MRKLLTAMFALAAFPALAQPNDLVENKRSCFVRKVERSAPDEDPKSYPPEVSAHCARVAKEFADRLKENDTPEVLQMRGRALEQLRARSK